MGEALLWGALGGRSTVGGCLNYVTVRTVPYAIYTLEINLCHGFYYFGEGK